MQGAKFATHMDAIMSKIFSFKYFIMKKILQCVIMNNEYLIIEITLILGTRIICASLYYFLQYSFY